MLIYLQMIDAPAEQSKFERLYQAYRRLMFTVARQLLPTMQSDIVLFSHKTGKILIINAKYYTHTLQTHGRYLNKTIHSANLYQIFTYVKNWAAGPGETVSGMLLYARTDEPVQPDHDYQMNGNQISVKTVDLSCPFSGIAAQLDAIAERVAK